MKSNSTITALKRPGFDLIIVLILMTGNLATAQIVRQSDEGINIDRSKRIVGLTSEIAGELFINDRLIAEIGQPDSLFIINLEDKVINLKFSDNEGQKHETGVIIPSRRLVTFHISHDGIELKDPGKRYELVARDIKGETVFYVPDNVWYMEVNYATAGALSLTGGYRFFPGFALGLGVTNQPVIGWGDEYAGGARIGLTQQVYLQLALENRLVNLTIEQTHYENGNPVMVRYNEMLDPLYIRFGLGFQFL